MFERSTQRKCAEASFDGHQALHTAVRMVLSSKLFRDRSEGAVRRRDRSGLRTCGRAEFLRRASSLPDSIPQFCCLVGFSGFFTHSSSIRKEAGSIGASTTEFLVNLPLMIGEGEKPTK